MDQQQNQDILSNEIAQLMPEESCPRHPDQAIISVCFISDANDQVFHCSKCEVEAPSSHSHVKLSDLNQAVPKESPISKWPIINDNLMSRIQLALSWSSGDLNEEESKDIRLNQTCLEEEYHKYSQQKEFRSIIMKRQSTISQKTQEIISLMKEAKEIQSQIEDELEWILTAFQTSINKRILLNQESEKESVQLHSFIEEMNQLDQQLPSQKPNQVNKSDKDSNLKSNVFKIEFKGYLSSGYFESVNRQIALLPNITSLILQFPWIKVDEAALEQCQVMLAQNNNIKSLTLAFFMSQLGKKSVNRLANLLAVQQNLEDLTIDLRQNPFGEAEFQVLGNSIQLLQNLKSLELTMGNIYFSAKGIKSLCDSISRLQNLKQLELDFIYDCFNGGGNELSEEEYQALCDSLTRFSSLESITLLFKSNGVWHDKLTLLGVSLANIKTLTSIRLEFFGDSYVSDTFIGMTDKLASMPNLRSLNLVIEGNNISRREIPQLFDSLSRFKNIHFLLLNLSGRSYKENSIRKWKRKIKKLCSNLVEFKFINYFETPTFIIQNQPGLEDYD